MARRGFAAAVCRGSLSRAVRGRQPPYCVFIAFAVSRGMLKLFRRLLFCAALVTPLAVPVCRAAQPARLIVTNAYLITMAPDQKTPFIGYLVVNDEGKITQVGPGSPPAGLTAQETWDARGDWIIPGFLSAHSHLWQAAFRGISPDQTLPGWIEGLYYGHARYAQPEDYYWFTLYGALDHLEHGITGAYDFAYGGTQWGPCKANDCDEPEFKAETDSGIRFIHGYQPDTIRPGDTPAMALARLTAFMHWVDEQPKDSRFLSVMLNGAVAFNDTYEQAVSEKQQMDKFHIGNQSHYLEPLSTAGEEQSKFRWFMDSGMLGPSLYFGHFIHTNDFILEQVAKAHGGMSWNPLSNGRLASGVADIPKYLKMGIRVGMGVDGEASADLADPFENMRTGLYAVRDLYQNAAIMSPYEVLYLQTMGSADVMGVKDKLGSLEPGKFADFDAIDPKCYGTVFNPYASLVFVTQTSDIDRVYVGGRLAVDHGKVVHQDMTKILDEVETRSKAAVLHAQ
jgi:cytosine/adenosine deaminase-related metal-dependent hydrolase